MFFRLMIILTIGGCGDPKYEEWACGLDSP